MSDAPLGVTGNISALVDEIVSKSKRRPSENFKSSHYAGVASAKNRRKYRNCEYVRQGRNAVRKLSVVELAEFRAAVQLAIEAAT